MALQNHQSSIGAAHLIIRESIPGDKKTKKPTKNTFTGTNLQHNNMHRAYGTNFHQTIIFYYLCVLSIE
jgi:hypothetical protein